MVMKQWRHTVTWYDNMIDCPYGSFHYIFNFYEVYINLKDLLALSTWDVT